MLRSIMCGIVVKQIYLINDATEKTGEGFGMCSY